MGYSSEIRCLIYGTKEELDAFLTTEVIIGGSTVLKDFKENLTRYEHRISSTQDEEETIIHVLDLYGDSWKWYKSYEDVQAWHKFMEEAKDQGLQYEFIRIGENVGDIVHDSSEDANGFLSTTNPSIYCELEPETLLEIL